MDGRAADLREIRDLIDSQFGSMSWSAGGGPDTTTFRDGFLPGAPLYPSARPVSVRSLDEFTKRMGELAQTMLTSFHERVIGTKVLVFGNVALAAVACENTENGGEVNRNVEMMLLVKSDGHWKICRAGLGQGNEQRADTRRTTGGLLTLEPEPAPAKRGPLGSGLWWRSPRQSDDV